MGAMSAMSSMDRVIQQHGNEISAEWKDAVKEPLQNELREVGLNNDTYGISVLWIFNNGDTLPGPTMHIDELAERFPDCKVGY